MRFYEKYNDNNYISSDDYRKKITLKDKGSSIYQCLNDSAKRVIIYNVDNGIIKSQTIAKCDYALYNFNDDTVYFIELKGANYDRAVEQIESTINNLIINNNIEISIINARIVLTRAKTPQLNTTKEQKLKKILRKYSGTLDKKCNILTDNI